MGTLTGDLPRLSQYCDHKLPTSCRLSSIPSCCACADERPHSTSYPTYVDGVGFVPRGTRHQRYCYYCKVFWENRIAQTNLVASQTRIPQVPDQSEFLQKWYEFHRGYRIVTRPDGSEERISVLGEPFRDVDPGQLPRTLDELRSGNQRSAADQPQHIDIARDSTLDGPSIEDALDLMLEAAETEDTQPAQPSQPAQHAQSAQPAEAPRVAGHIMRPAPSRNHEYQARRIAALRRELHRMRNGIERVISGLRDLGESVPDSTEATGRLSDLGRTLDLISASQPPSSQEPSAANRESRAPVVGSVYRDQTLTSPQLRLAEAQRQLEQAQSFREQASAEFHIAQTAHSEAAEVLESADIDLAEHREQVSQLRREQRTAENYARLFGTREDMQAPDYESPITGMFTRAWERFRVAEAVRAEERTLRQTLEDERLAPGHLFTEDHDDSLPDNTIYEDHLNEYYTMLRQQNWTQDNVLGHDRNSPPSNEVPGVDHNVSETNGPIPAIRNEDRGPQESPPHMPQLERLLRNTPEPARSAIIARMVENGTAQALEESPAGNVIDVWRRLRDSYAPFRGPDLVYSSESEEEPDNVGKGLDVEDSGRPDPKDDEELTLKLECKICYTQVADTACLPCGHLVMCQWCSEQHSPVMRHDKTRPSRPANCPVCRKKIKQKVRIFRA